LPRGRSILFLATEDWYFAGHRLKLARAALDAGYGVSVATRVNRHAREIGDAGVRLLTMDWTRGSLDPFRINAEVHCAARFIADEKPDIVHCVSLRPVVVACLALRRLPRQRVVLAFTGLGYLFVGTSAWKRMARQLVCRVIAAAARRHDVVLLFENREDRDTIVSFAGLEGVRAEVNPGSGIDATRFVPLPQPGEAPPVFAFAGRLLRIKGIEELAAASRLLDARGVAHEVILAGPLDPASRSGFSESELRKLIDGSSVQWIGEAADIRDVWSRADIALAPSHGGEGVPLALVEAAACGRALIASDVPGCRDIVVAEETGLLVPPRDAAALAAAMERLVGDAPLRYAMAGRAAERARSQFTAVTVNERTLAIYRDLLDGKDG